VLWGTLFPTISEAVSGDRIALDAEWYNRLMVPIGLFLLFLTGVGRCLPGGALRSKACAEISSGRAWRRWCWWARC
jgi:cytochrome c biogenesis factor